MIAELWAMMRSDLWVATPEMKTVLIGVVIAQALMLFWFWLRVANLENQWRLAADSLDRTAKSAEAAKKQILEHTRDAQRWPHYSRKEIDGWIEEAIHYDESIRKRIESIARVELTRIEPSRNESEPSSVIDQINAALKKDPE